MKQEKRVPSTPEISICSTIPESTYQTLTSFIERDQTLDVDRVVSDAIALWLALQRVQHILCSVRRQVQELLAVGST